VKRREETTTFQSKDLSFVATHRAKRTKKRGVWGFPPSRRRPSRDLSMKGTRGAAAARERVREKNERDDDDERREERRERVLSLKLIREDHHFFKQDLS